MPAAILVAHGAPADPEPQDLVLHDLAKRVGALLPDWEIRGATLAREGSLACALDGLVAPLIYPFFMAEGWFTKRELPRRVAEAGHPDLTYLDPLGVDPDLPDLIARAAQGVQPPEVSLTDGWWAVAMGMADSLTACPMSLHNPRLTSVLTSPRLITPLMSMPSSLLLSITNYT